MSQFNYAAPAELFGNRGHKGRPHPVRYRRFASGAEAVRFAVEAVPAALLVGLTLESDEDRFDHSGIRQLYESPDYPLDRDAAED